MGKIFLTSDLHLGHDREFVWKVRGYNSVEEMNVKQIEKWNSVVGNDDDVYVLGDLCLGGHENVELLKTLNGKIHIVLGNHDTTARQNLYMSLENVVEIEWAIMLNYKKYHFFMTHFPSMTGNLEKETLRQMTLNLYGHTHQKTKFFEDRPYMYHVGVDAHNGYPILLDDIIQEMRAKVKECIDFLDVEPAATAVELESLAPLLHHRRTNADCDTCEDACDCGCPNCKGFHLPVENLIVSTLDEPPAINIEAAPSPLCDKCSNTWPYCGGIISFTTGTCDRYHRDPPDGGCYG